jgi:hypothetical protein
MPKAESKEEEEITVSVRFPESQYEEFKALAEKEHRSLGQQALVMILKQMGAQA